MTSTQFRALNIWRLPLSWLAEHIGDRRVSMRTMQHWYNGRLGEDVEVPDDVCTDLERVSKAISTVLKPRA